MYFERHVDNKISCSKQVEWTKDNAGRWKIEEVPDSEKIYPCQLVLLAMGFLGPETAVLDNLKIDQVLTFIVFSLQGSKKQLRLDLVLQKILTIGTLEKLQDLLLQNFV